MINPLKSRKMKRLFFAGMTLLVNITVYAQERADITVKMEEVKNQGKGQVVFMLFDKEDGFPKEVEKAKFKAQVKDVKGNISHTFEDVPYGKYAICVFHDENGNGEIDSNFIGIPKEPVAASNMTGMGKPSFKKCTIVINKPKNTFIMNFIND